MPRSWLSLLLAVLLAAHFGFCVVRWPAGTLKKRAESIAEYRALGASGWHYRLDDEATGRTAAWLLANVGDDEVVLFDGGRAGALQLLAPLLFPRLLVEASARRGAVDSKGRRVFATVPPWLPADGAKMPVVVGAPQRLRLELR